jgi:hypothetical protein
MMPGHVHARVAGALAALLVALAVALAAPATATDSNGTGQGTAISQAQWAAQATAGSASRALTLDEIRARGLERFVDTAKIAAGEARQAAAPTASAAPDPTVKRADSKTAGTLASGCWNWWFRYGTSHRYGQTDVTWRGDGTWVTYSTSTCWGYNSAYPTYKYLGCTLSTAYGHPYPNEHWNVYDVWTLWNLCVVWVPVWGSCATHDYPKLKYRFGGGGGVWPMSA